MMLQQMDQKTTYVDGVIPGVVSNDKAAIYSATGSLHTNSLYLQDSQQQNFIGNHDHNKLHVVITQTDQLIKGTKPFHDLRCIAPVNNKSAVNKEFVESKTNNLTDLSKSSVQSYSGRVTVPDYNPLNHSESDVLNEKYTEKCPHYLNKVNGL